MLVSLIFFLSTKESKKIEVLSPRLRRTQNSLILDSTPRIPDSLSRELF